MILRPKNWEKFQHYKDRNPPWIKVHKKQLDDPDFMVLSFASIGLAQLLWLLASESKDGSFGASMKDLTFRLRKPESEIKKLITPLIRSGFFEVLADDSAMLADDTESCSEGETEGETDSCANDEKFEKFWDAFDYKKGRAGALKSWNKINLTDELWMLILSGALIEAKNRPALINRGSTPKMAQGWLTDSRWEDEATATTEKKPSWMMGG